MMRPSSRVLALVLFLHLLGGCAESSDERLGDWTLTRRCDALGDSAPTAVGRDEAIGIALAKLRKMRADAGSRDLESTMLACGLNVARHDAEWRLHHDGGDVWLLTFRRNEGPDRGRLLAIVAVEAQSGSVLAATTGVWDSVEGRETPVPDEFR
jgi:hypothetical protein